MNILQPGTLRRHLSFAFLVISLSLTLPRCYNLSPHKRLLGQSGYTPGPTARRWPTLFRQL